MMKRFTLFWMVGLLAMGAAQARSTDSQPQDLSFKVMKDDSPLGQHQITFSQEGEELHVRVSIELEVNFAFVTLFRYSHRNHEIWRDGRLIAIETETNDDGEAHWVRGEAGENGFEIESSSGRSRAPLTIIPTSYWHPDTVNQVELLDTQHGRVVAVTAENKGNQLGPNGTASRYALSGDLNLDLWYEDTGHLAKIAFEARGSEIDYIPLTIDQTPAAPVAQD